MSDFFISQVLVLLPSLVFLIRPFIRTLRRLNGIPVFPLIALVIEIFSMFAFGFCVEMIPVALCCVIIFLISIPGLVMFFLGLPTDEIRIGSIVFCCIGLLFLSVGAYIMCDICPVSPPEVSVVGDIQKYQLQLYRTHSGQFAIKNGIRDIAMRTEAICSIWAPIKDCYKGGDCPLVYYVPGSQNNRNSRETMARILASNGYIVIAADFPRRSYIVRDNDILRYFENILAVRQMTFLAYKGNLPDFYVQRNKAWLQSTLNGIQEVSNTLFSKHSNETNDAIAVFQSQLPLYVAKEPYVIIEQFSVDSMPDITLSNIDESAGIVFLCNEPITAFQQLFSLNVAELLMPPECIEYSSIVLTGDHSTLFPFGEAYINHPVFASLYNVSPESRPKLLELTTAYKIRTYFDARRNRPISVMQ